jgi:hypothetical protein
VEQQRRINITNHFKKINIAPALASFKKILYDFSMKTIEKLAFLMIFFLMQSCDSGIHGKKIDDGKFAKVYAKLTRNAVPFQMLHGDTTGAVRIADSIFAAEGVSRQDMKEKAGELNADPARWIAIYDLVEKEMNPPPPPQPK